MWSRSRVWQLTKDRVPNYRPVYAGKRHEGHYDGVREYGRVRVYEDASLLLYNLLRVERDRITLQRRAALEDNPEVSTQTFNREIKLIDQLLDEVNRTRTECGWV